jgi:beta-barrel assembly-enhancing protease
MSLQGQAARVCQSGIGLLLFLAVCLTATSVLGSSSQIKRSDSDRDINAIGHRKIANRKDPSQERLGWEKGVGAQMSSNLERSTPLLRDPTASTYVEHLAQNVAQNSDARFPITVRIIDSEEVYALTLPAGYQYITRGLLLRIANECELASVLARGIAHTALRSPMNAPVYIGHDDYVRDSVQKKRDEFEREEELNADYFGIQYLYKSGYDPGCFLTLIPRVWTDNPAKEFRAFPPVPARLEALQEEIIDILPKRDGAVTTTPEFTGFREYLLKLNPPKTER